jgi:hypothetical protein
MVLVAVVLLLLPAALHPKAHAHRKKSVPSERSRHAFSLGIAFSDCADASHARRIILQHRGFETSYSGAGPFVVAAGRHWLMRMDDYINSAVRSIANLR